MNNMSMDEIANKLCKLDIVKEQLLLEANQLTLEIDILHKIINHLKEKRAQLKVEKYVVLERLLNDQII